MTSGRTIVEMLERGFDDPRERACVLYEAMGCCPGLRAQVSSETCRLIGSGVPAGQALSNALDAVLVPDGLGSVTGLISSAMSVVSDVVGGIAKRVREKRKQREERRRIKREARVVLSDEEVLQVAETLVAAGHRRWDDEATRQAAIADIEKIRPTRKTFLSGEAERLIRALKVALKQKKREERAALRATHQKQLLIIGGGGVAALLVIALLLRKSRS